jgi:hypothetical protein
MLCRAACVCRRPGPVHQTSIGSFVQQSQAPGQLGAGGWHVLWSSSPTFGAWGPDNIKLGASYTWSCEVPGVSMLLLHAVQHGKLSTRQPMRLMGHQCHSAHQCSGQLLCHSTCRPALKTALETGCNWW